MGTHKLNGYLFGLLLALFLCIGTTHAGKLIEHDCYLSDSQGRYVDLKGKSSSKPIYIFNWEVEGDAAVTIKRPYPVDNLIIGTDQGMRSISFKHSYCGKNIAMTDQWELLQSKTETPTSEGEFLDLTLSLNIGHNKNPTESMHKLFCSKTSIDPNKANTTPGTPYIVPKDDYFSSHTPRENSTNSDDEGDSAGSVTFHSRTNSDEQCSNASFEDKANQFWAQEALELEKEEAEQKKAAT